MFDEAEKLWKASNGAYNWGEWLEPVCCKKRQKIIPDQLLVWGIRALRRF